MTRRALDVVGNSLTVGSATIATITHEDLRLWIVAVVGIVISLLCNLPRVKQRRYEAQEARQKLCAECLKDLTYSSSCVVEKKFRPRRCPLNKKANG